MVGWQRITKSVWWIDGNLVVVATLRAAPGEEGAKIRAGGIPASVVPSAPDTGFQPVSLTAVQSGKPAVGVFGAGLKLKSELFYTLK